MTKKYGCQTDATGLGMCVFDASINDNLTISDCNMAINLEMGGLGKESCPYWKEMPVQKSEYIKRIES